MHNHNTRTLVVVLFIGLIALVFAGAIGAPAMDNETTAAADGEIISLDHPEVIDADGEFQITVETADSAGTIVEIDPNGFDVALESDDAVRIEENQVQFLDPAQDDSTYTIDVDVIGGTAGDTGEIVTWINAEDREDADDELVSSVAIEDEDSTDESTGEIISIDHPETIEPDDTFELTVETVESAGTIVEFVPDGFDVDLSSDDAVSIEDNQVQFLDPGEGNSTYTIEVDVTDSSDGDTGEIVAWVNAEVREDADDELVSTVTIEADEDDDIDPGPSGAPPADFLAFADTTQPDETEPGGLQIRVGSELADEVTVQVIEDTETESRLNITAPDDATNVTFYLQTQAIEAAHDIDNVTMFVDHEADRFYIDEEAGPGQSPWIAFQIENFSTRTVAFRSETSTTDDPEIVVGDSPATDTTGDDLLNDVVGDNSFTIFDVQLFFQERNSDEIQDNVEFFDFAQDGNVDIFDVQALFNQLQQQDQED